MEGTGLNCRMWWSSNWSSVMLCFVCSWDETTNIHTHKRRPWIPSMGRPGPLTASIAHSERRLIRVGLKPNQQCLWKLITVFWDGRKNSCTLSWMQAASFLPHSEPRSFSLYRWAETQGNISSSRLQQFSTVMHQQFVQLTTAWGLWQENKGLSSNYQEMKVFQYGRKCQ